MVDPRGARVPPLAQRRAPVAAGVARRRARPTSTSSSVDARPGDRLLLCSDGLTDMVGDERIAEVLRLKDPHSAAAVLTHAALEAGGHDNITCVVVDVIDGPLVVGDGRLLGAVSDLGEHRRPRRRPPRLTTGLPEKRPYHWYSPAPFVTMGAQLHTCHLESRSSRRDRWGRRISTPEKKGVHGDRTHCHPPNRQRGSGVCCTSTRRRPRCARTSSGPWAAYSALP